MFETIWRQFEYRSKYVFTVHLHHITPWFMDDQSAVITWKRGNRQNRRGETKLISPKKQHPNDKTSILHIDEIFDLEVTLFSEGKDTQKRGPYYPKELKLKVKIVENDKSVRLTLGVVIIQLNEFADLLEHSLKLPIKCEENVIFKSGPPELHLTLRSWSKKSTGDSSTLSDLTSIGQSHQEVPKSEKCDFQDPVRIQEDGENSTIVIEQSKGLIVEKAVLEEGIKSVKKPEGVNQEVPVILTLNEENTITLLEDSEHDRISELDQNSSEKTEQVDAEIDVSTKQKEAEIEVSTKEKEAEMKIQDQDPVHDLIRTSDSISSIQENKSTEVKSNLNKTQTPNHKKPQSTQSTPRWIIWFSWIPGSRLICCQPNVPKEP